MAKAVVKGLLKSLDKDKPKPKKKKPEPFKLPENYQSPDSFGPEVTTRRAGEVIEAPRLQFQTPAGYVEDPISQLAIAGEYGEGVPKAMITKEQKALEQSERYRAMQEKRPEGSRVVATQDTALPSISWEQLQGRPAIMLPADMAIGGGLLQRVGGVDIEPMYLHGGPFYSDIWKSWASDSGAATGKQAHAMKVMEETGQLPFMIYSPMQHAGSNFSYHPSMAQLRYLEATGDLDAAGKAQLDQMMRSLLDKGDTKNIAKNWEGYSSARDMMDLITNRERAASLGFSTGNLRKALTPILGQKQMQMHGTLPLSDIYQAVNEPNMHNMAPRQVGLRGLLAEFEQPENLKPTTEDMAISYNTQIPAQQAFQIEGGTLPAQVLFRDMFQSRSNKNPAQAYRSAQTSGSAQDYQMLDQETIDRIMRYMEMNQQ